MMMTVSSVSLLLPSSYRPQHLYICIYGTITPVTSWLHVYNYIYIYIGLSETRVPLYFHAYESLHYLFFSIVIWCYIPHFQRTPSWNRRLSSKRTAPQRRCAKRSSPGPAHRCKDDSRSNQNGWVKHRSCGSSCGKWIPFKLSQTGFVIFLEKILSNAGKMMNRGICGFRFKPKV